jgi:hypothetical protein
MVVYILLLVCSVVNYLDFGMELGLCEVIVWWMRIVLILVLGVEWLY